MCLVLSCDLLLAVFLVSGVCASCGFGSSGVRARRVFGDVDGDGVMMCCVVFCCVVLHCVVVDIFAVSIGRWWAILMFLLLLLLLLLLLFVGRRLKGATTRER